MKHEPLSKIDRTTSQTVNRNLWDIFPVYRTSIIQHHSKGWFIDPLKIYVPSNNHPLYGAGLLDCQQQKSVLYTVNELLYTFCQGTKRRKHTSNLRSTPTGLSNQPIPTAPLGRPAHQPVCSFEVGHRER